MGVAAVRGLHGGNTQGPSSYLPPGTIVSEAKHAAAYGYGGKDGAGADISERTLYDVYLRPWRDYARNGGRGAMMVRPPELWPADQLCSTRTLRVLRPQCCH